MTLNGEVTEKGSVRLVSLLLVRAMSRNVTYLKLKKKKLSTERRLV